MKYTIDFSDSFALEFSRVKGDQQYAVTAFVQIYQTHGLVDQTKFTGRLSPSWHNLPKNHPNYVYTTKQHLWHYHLGLPTYTGSQYWGQTSDWLLHFQWPDGGNHISLVDMYQHWTWDRKFYLPPVSALAKNYDEEPE